VRFNDREIECLREREQTRTEMISPGKISREMTPSCYLLELPERRGGLGAVAEDTEAPAPKHRRLQRVAAAVATADAFPRPAPAGPEADSWPLLRRRLRRPRPRPWGSKHINRPTGNDTTSF